MKLLTKSQIDSARSMEQQIRVEEGLRLARKVDALRETRAQDEASLSAYRVETLSAIQREITEAEEKRVRLLDQVKDLKSQAETAFVPLMVKEDFLKREEERLKVITQSQDEKQSNLEQLEVALKEEKRVLAAEKLDVHNKHTLLANAAQDFLNEKAEFVAASTATQRQLKQQSEELGALRGDLNMREKKLQKVEQEINRKSQSLEEMEREYARRERLLTDREQTLARNIKRYGQRK